nr:MAG TPA: hypothetical protein [Caudoviricetes sp.]
MLIFMASLRPDPTCYIHLLPLDLPDRTMLDSSSSRHSAARLYAVQADLCKR